MRRRMLSLLLAVCMVLGMLPMNALAADIPEGTNISRITEVTEITEGDQIDFSMWGMDYSAPSYVAKIPAGTETVTVTFASGTHPDPYTDSSTGVLKLSGCWAVWSEGSASYSGSGVNHDCVQEEDGLYSITLDAAAMIEGNKFYGAYDASYGVQYMLGFVYGEEASSNDKPFLSIAIDGKALEETAITFKTLFDLGSLESSYSYIHEDVPYYHISVPCGTAYVDVTYSADTNIFDYGTTAYGYATELTVDSVSSATVKGRTFKDAYTLNEDGTQTVKTPVTGYTFDADGNGMAVTLEEEGDTYEAVCLFSFEYDGKDHVYGEGTVTTQPGCTEDGVKTFACSCGHSYTEGIAALGHSFDEGSCTVCGEADPDYEVPGGLVIPEGAPFTAITTDQGEALSAEYVEDVTYTGYGTYENVPYYHIQIPAGAAEVYVTHPSSEDPFADAGYNSAYGYYAETSGWTGSGMSFAFTDAEDGYTITLPLNYSAQDWSTGETVEMSFLTDETGTAAYAVAVERNSYDPICFFTFEYAGETGEHSHSYTESITTEPTCTEAGVRTFTCSCGDSYTEEIAAPGHSYDAGVVTTEPTCTAEGVKTFTCANCGDTYTESVAVTGHSYDEGTVTTEATCTEDGVKTFTCANCGGTETEAIAAVGHTYVDKVCTVCGDVDTRPDQDENGVYQIATAGQLLWFAEAVNGGETAISGALTEDIDLSETEWPGIGCSSYKFAGSFDGQGHTVTIRDALCGLFGYTKGTGSAYVQIKNVTVDGAFSGHGGIVGIAIYTNVENCINKADISGGVNAGGIVGKVDSNGWQGQSGATITNCANEGTITGETYVGGILGYAQVGGQVIGCSNTGAVSGTSSVGGLVGWLQEYKGTSEVKNGYNLGSVSGTSQVGGLVGSTYNGVSIANSYNAGECSYGVTGQIYNNTVTISNTYFQGTKSEKGVPDNTYTNISVESKTAAEMSSEEFAALLGDAFQTSCPAPVLTWQTASGHTGMEDEVCDVCGFGSNVKEVYTVTVTAPEGVTVVGEQTAQEGENYTFSVNISEEYEATDDFCVKVNNETAEAVDGIYTVEAVTGPLGITVTGVRKLPDAYAVTLPGAGKGYRVNGEATAARGEDYAFTVTFVNGFRAGDDFCVMANGVALNGIDGAYTIENVRKEQTITVSGVEMIPSEATADVNLTITYGEKKFYEAEQTGTIMLDQNMTVPYFDLGLYDLEKYYYTPYCYINEDGSIRGNQISGNIETAYGIVTTMHAFIYATEVYYLGMDPADAGTGLSHEMDSDGDGVSDFDEAVSWSGGAGSSFMNLWDHGTNLNYYVNYEYPLAYEGWGSTADQQHLRDGDVLSIHLIENGKVSGSNFAVITANDEDKAFTLEDTMDRTAVTQGQCVDLTLYQTVNTNKYYTEYATVAQQNLYWIEADTVTNDISDWNRDGFGAMTADTFVTGSNGTVTVDTTGLEPGTYYVGALGGLTAGGAVDNAGFVSRGGETGAAFFELTVLERMTGDFDADGSVSEEEADRVVKHYKGEAALTAAELAQIDTDGNGIVSLAEAAAVVRNHKK